MTLTGGLDVSDLDERGEIDRAADGDIEFDTAGEIEISELRDEVRENRAELEVEGERVEMKDDDAEGLSERDTTDEELPPLIDREIDVVNVSNAVYDGVLTPESDTIAVAVTTKDDDGISDIDCIAEVDWLTRTLDETVREATTDGVKGDDADITLEIDVRGELLETAVGLTVITLEIVNTGESDNKLDTVVIIETVGVSVGIDAFAECVELDVTVPVIDCIDDLNEDEDAVLDCRADDESESIFDTEATVEAVGEAVGVAILLPLCTIVDNADSEFDEVVVNDDRGVILNAAVVVASVDCDTLEVTDNEKRGVVVARALLDDDDEKDDEPELLLLTFPVNEVNTVLET